MSSSDATSATGFVPQVRRVTLEKQSEIRIQVPQISPLKLRVLHGKVEIFGSELPRNVWLTFPPLQQFAVCSTFSITTSFHFLFSYVLERFCHVHPISFFCFLLLLFPFVGIMMRYSYIASRLASQVFFYLT